MSDNDAMSEEEGEEGTLGLPAFLRFRPLSSGLQSNFLSLLSGAVLATVVLLAVIHISDRMRADHVAGAWMALTQYAKDGVIYPPIFDGSHYAGTRWMPLALLYNIAFTVFSDDLLFTGKLASLFGAILVLVLLYLLLITIKVQRAYALLLVAVVVVSEPMLTAIWAPFRGDSPALALQLLALLAVLRAPASARVSALVGVVAAVAFLTKFSAGWAPMAIGLFYLVRARRLLPFFVVPYALVLLVGLPIFEWLSDGRMSENLFGVGVGTLSLQELKGSPRRIFHALEFEGQPLLILLPFAVAELWRGLRGGRVHLLHLSLLGVGVVTWFVFTDVGAAANHLVDLACLVALLMGLAWRRAAHSTAPEWVQGMLLTVTLGALVVGIDLSLTNRIQELMRGGPTDYSASRYEDLATPQQRVLSEDPTVSVRLGQTPVVMDAFMWRRWSADHPLQSQALFERVQRHEFDRIVLLQNAELGLKNGWYVEMHFGEAFVKHVLQHYVLIKTVEGYWVYGPKP